MISFVSPAKAACPDATPWLSVLVPAYNVAPYIAAMLESATAQAIAGVEIVVIDDASTDATAPTVERIAAESGFIRFVRHESNLGVAATRNHLLDLARGEYLWFVDADDVIARGSLARARDILRATPVDLLMCDFRTIGGAFRLRNHRSTFAGVPGGGSREALVTGALQAGQLHIWSKIARRELWQAARFPERRRFEDMAAVARLLTQAERWRHVPEAWIGYRQRPGSLSRDVPQCGLPDYADALHEVATVVAPQACDRASRHALEYFLLRGHASIARRLVQCGAPAGESIATSCRTRFDADFPDRADAALAACRRRGWWLRAHRIERALVRAGWR